MSHKKAAKLRQATTGKLSIKILNCVLAVKTYLPFKNTISIAYANSGLLKTEEGQTKGMGSGEIPQFFLRRMF